MLQRMARNALPEQDQHREVAVSQVDAGAAEFQYLRAHGLEGREFELAFAAVTQAVTRKQAGLQPVGADHLAGTAVLDVEVVADGVEGSASSPVSQDCTRPSSSSRLKTSKRSACAARRSSAPRASRARQAGAPPRLVWAAWPEAALVFIADMGGILSYGGTGRFAGASVCRATR